MFTCIDESAFPDDVWLAILGAECDVVSVWESDCHGSVSGSCDEVLVHSGFIVSGSDVDDWGGSAWDVFFC